MENILKDIVIQQKKENYVGIYSACSANRYVIEAVLAHAKKEQYLALIESTANQVNQFGGYIGMTPNDFREFVYAIAKEVGIDKKQIILGGDHLGPLLWVKENVDNAMEKAADLIESYVTAGFTKIHIDTSMKLAGDPVEKDLHEQLIVERACFLAQKAQSAFVKYKKEFPDAITPVYVIGSEVPIPGGVGDEEGIHVTTPSDYSKTIKDYNEAFLNRELYDIWENVIAVVVQPGVEFGNDSVHEYNREVAKDLTNELKKFPNLVFEGHSTDYQTKEKLREMVEDGVAILKVGPQLTFALREVLYLLELCEMNLVEEGKQSNFRKVLEEEMMNIPEHWEKHYLGNAKEQKLYRSYSYSDRCRYYLSNTIVEAAIQRLLSNLIEQQIPLMLLSNYLPKQYLKIREGILTCEPQDIIQDYLFGVLDDYLYATEQGKLIVE